MDAPESGTAGPYRPIECQVHDRLEDLAVRRKVCVVRHRTGSGEVSEEAGQITDIYSRNGAEYLDLDSGLTIRLDALVSFEEL